jgi:flagellar protein FliS
MTSASGLSGAQQYKRLGLEGEIRSASPHRLIQMLMEGLVGKIMIARHCIENNNIAGKGENISMAISIVSGLRVSLDKEKGGEIAVNLENLYDYMERRLLEANLRSDIGILDEVKGLIEEIKSAWSAISEEIIANQQAV